MFANTNRYTAFCAFVLLLVWERARGGIEKISDEQHAIYFTAESRTIELEYEVTAKAVDSKDTTQEMSEDYYTIVIYEV